MGYTGYSIEEIEDALVSTLKNDTTLSAYVKIFDRLPWERATEAEKLVKQYPALLVAYAGGKDDTDNFNVCDHMGRFAVWCAARNLRTPSAALTGPETGEKGVYDLLKDVLSCLNYSNLGLDISYCKAVRVLALAASPRVAIFSREFEVSWRYSYAP
jgi:phage gp37-like protein